MFLDGANSDLSSMVGKYGSRTADVAESRDIVEPVCWKVGKSASVPESKEIIEPVEIVKPALPKVVKSEGRRCEK